MQDESSPPRAPRSSSRSAVGEPEARRSDQTARGDLRRAGLTGPPDAGTPGCALAGQAAPTRLHTGPGGFKFLAVTLVPVDSGPRGRFWAGAVSARHVLAAGGTGPGWCSGTRGRHRGHFPVPPPLRACGVERPSPFLLRRRERGAPSGWRGVAGPRAQDAALVFPPSCQPGRWARCTCACHAARLRSGSELAGRGPAREQAPPARRRQGGQKAVSPSRRRGAGPRPSQGLPATGWGWVRGGGDAATPPGSRPLAWDPRRGPGPHLPSSFTADTALAVRERSPPPPITPTASWA